MRLTRRQRWQPYKLTLDRGLQLRIAPDGARTLLVRYTVKGSAVERQYRLPQEYGEGPGQMKLAAACAEAARIRALARDGVDWPAQEEARLRAEVAARELSDRQDGLTVEKALREYVEKKRRAKDGLPLKSRTKADYLGMIEAGRESKAGGKFADGKLFSIAQTLLSKLTAQDIRRVHTDLAKRSEREAAYAMQVLRAVLRWHGVVIPGNPLGRDTAGRDRIVITASTGNPSPIPPERLGAWWRASGAAPSRIAADYYRFQLLTGCRGGEIHGNKRHGYEPIKVGDVDCQGGTFGDLAGLAIDEVRKPVHVVGQLLVVEAVAQAQLIVGVAPAFLHARQVQVHVHARHRWGRKQARGEGLVAVVADLLAEDRLAVLEDHHEALAAQFLELLRQQQRATLFAIVAADGAVPVAAEGPAPPARGGALGEVSKHGAVLVGIALLARRIEDLQAVVGGEGAGCCALPRASPST
jgi:Arm DNA-binding domain